MAMPALATIPNLTRDLQARDNAHFLHPFTDYRELHAEGARVQVRGEGIYTWDSDGRRVIDGLAGLGCVNIGYGRRELGAVAARQMESLSFSQSFFKTTNGPAIELSEQLVGMTPAGLNHVFFSTSGSEANETALKMIQRYWALVERPEKAVVITRSHAYHGSTIATTSVSGIPPLFESIGAMSMPGVARIGAPYWYLNHQSETPDDFGVRAARWLEDKILELGQEKVAAFIAEPMQGAGGAIIPPRTYWPEIQRICRQYDVLLVIDEVVTGFGRSGTWFGCEAFGIEAPDLMTLAKGITSSYFPLSATMVSDRIASLLIDKGGEFYHGFTNSGHPVGCAVALENLRIMREERIVENAAEVEPLFRAQIKALEDHPLVGDTRVRGLLCGIQLVADKENRVLFDSSLRVGERCSAAALELGLALRAVEDTMALMPPLIVKADEIEQIVAITRQALDDTARSLGML